MISRALVPYVSSIQALELSTKMAERYNELAAASEIPSVKATHAIEGNLLADAARSVELSGTELHDFDIAAVGAGLHHFQDPARAIGRLAERLKPGGVLLIVDFVEEEQGWLPSGADHTIHKHGFSQGEMKELM
jgi:SAM-dependent methyltransferase